MRGIGDRLVREAVEEPAADVGVDLAIARTENGTRQEGSGKEGGKCEHDEGTKERRPGSETECNPGNLQQSKARRKQSSRRGGPDE